MATINKRPSGKWQATIRTGGVSRSKTFTKRADATSWARQTELQAERGQLQQSDRQTSTTTVADALAQFARDVSARRSNASASVEQIRLRELSRTSFARKPLDGLTATDVTAWRDKRLKQVQPSTVRREMTLLRSAVDHTQAENGAQNVVAQVKRPVATGRRERRMQAGEWHALLGACDSGRNKLMRPLLVLALETGMRRGELLAMRWQHVELQRCTVFLPRTKSGHPRTVPLSPLAQKTLAEIPRTNERVLPLTANSVRLAFERIRNRARVDDLHLHDLRHECISRLVERGLTLFEVQQVSGHRTLEMLQRYVHLQVGSIVARLHAAE